MRRTVIILIVATICSLQIAVGTAEAKGKLTVRPTTQDRGRKVHISGTAGCRNPRQVYIRSDPAGPNTAIQPKTKPLNSQNNFGTSPVIRSQARYGTYTLVSRCPGSGKVSATTKLRLAHTGLPVLPQLLLGLGLIGGGAALVRGSRRPRPRAPGGYPRKRVG
jgi:hypothetical protein